MTPASTGVCLLGLALILFWVAGRSVVKGRLASGLIAGLTALAPAATGGLFLGLAATFTAIDRLAGEAPVGTIEIASSDTGAYIARLQIANRDAFHYRLAGDHWQMDVRFLKWTLPALLLGAQGMYQLDRLSGRYSEVDRSGNVEVTAYGLTGAPGQALWQLASAAGRRVAWVDTIYGNAVYMPMADGARYRISVTASGLVARPDNAAARGAVARW
jgi:hypothetical protein